MRKLHTQSNNAALHCKHTLNSNRPIRFVLCVEFEMNDDDDDDIICEWLQFINQFSMEKQFCKQTVCSITHCACVCVDLKYSKQITSLVHLFPILPKIEILLTTEIVLIFFSHYIEFY